MRKIRVVAATELSTILRSKAFVVGVLVVPILVVLVTVAQLALERKVEAEARAFAVVDETGVLYDSIERAAEARNAALGTSSSVQPGAGPFVPVRIDQAEWREGGLEIELSDRVRKGELFAFVVIAPSVLDPDASPNASAAAVRYYSDHPAHFELPGWIDQVLAEAVREHRYRAAGIDVDLVRRLEARPHAERLGLVERAPDGELRPAAEVDPIRSYIVPLALMMLLFFPVMIGAPPLLQAVIEEKMSRVSEVLLGSVSPFELMMGKLLGGVGAIALLAGLYLAGGMALSAAFGLGALVTPSLLAFYVVFLLLAALWQGALYLAVGAACNEPRDAQSLLMPIVLVTMIPVMAVSAVIRAPASPLSVGLSLFPPATPFLMLLRLAAHPPPPWWQVALGIVLTLATVVVCVWIAARIFRIGLLAQGTAPSLKQLWRWIRAR